MTNLVLNALRHNTGLGGTVHVATTSTTGGGAELTVTNTGPVVPAELLATLTEPFVRGGRRLAAPGSGLGLAIVSRVAELHHAALHLAARSSGGLHVSVSFPAGSPGAATGR